tara:strand:- start:34 stop:450 length:417 start_codon:yes stop_codon:yes gene_type:complete
MIEENCTHKFNPYFGIGCLLIEDMPADSANNFEDLLSDMDDGYKISCFIRRYPSAHNIQFELHEKELYRAWVDFSTYRNWTQEMKDFWDWEKESQWEKDYQVKSIENGCTHIRYRYDCSSIEMKSLLVDPLNLPASEK